jgi:hypothetical protein
MDLFAPSHLLFLLLVIVVIFGRVNSGMLVVAWVRVFATSSVRSTSPITSSARIRQATHSLRPARVPFRCLTGTRGDSPLS